MEEVHTILSVGAGGVTKLRAAAPARIERIFNHKYPLEYVRDFDRLPEKQKKVDDFYADYLDT